MPRPITMFTGQWADLPLAALAPKIKAFGYDGVELACWGDHFDVGLAQDKKYCDDRHALLAKHGLKTWAISSHLVGQAICDNIDERHKSILPPHVWGDGKPADVQKRAAEEMIKTAYALKGWELEPDVPRLQRPLSAFHAPGEANAFEHAPGN